MFALLLNINDTAVQARADDRTDVCRRGEAVVVPSCTILCFIGGDDDVGRGGSAGKLDKTKSCFNFSM